MAKKSVTKKKKATPKPKARTQVKAIYKPTKASASASRPANSPDMPLNMIGNLQVAFAEIKTDLEEYRAPSRP
jgi:hypothetical protein